MKELGKTWAFIVLILGILLLLKDLNVWPGFTIQPWTLVFLVFGLIHSFKK